MDWTTTGSNANKWGASCDGIACNGQSGNVSYDSSTGTAYGDSGIPASATSNVVAGMNFSVDVDADSIELRSNDAANTPSGSYLDSDIRLPTIVNDTGDGNKSFTQSMLTAGPNTVSSDHTMGGNSYTYEYTQSGETITVQIITPTTHTDQLWVKWNNSNFSSPSYISYNFAIVGRNFPYSYLPSSGSATYTGGLDGYFKYDNNPSMGTLEGDSSFTANWATAKISGSFTNITMDLNGATSSWGDITLTDADITSSAGIPFFRGFGLNMTTGADIDMSNEWLYGSFYDSNPVNGQAPNSIGGNFRFQNSANTGFGAFQFAATKD